MNKTQETFNKVNEMSLKDLLILCSHDIDMNMDKARLDPLLLMLETKLSARRIASMRGKK